MKCDVIIPVYNSPEWIKLCIYALMTNTDDKTLNKVYLINDCSDEITTNLLNNLKNKYNKIEIINNEENLGFVKSTNKGLKMSNADYALLLNTDCIIAKHTIEKLINHIKKDNEIGLICPIASNAANISLPIYDGYTYAEMDKLLEKNFLGQSFDACTVVGNCLLISKKCLEKVGYLDEIYGMGYGEETDYQFKAMQAGFKAKVAIDTYVFHKAEVSFGTSKKKQERLEKNRKIFFDRWSKEYYALIEKYKENDPIKYIEKNIKKEKIEFEFLIYLVGINQTSGGIHFTIDMINYLTIKGLSCNVLYGFIDKYDEIMLFNPIQVKQIDKYNFKKLVSTIYYSTYYMKYLSDKYKVPLIYFAQGYESYFENGLDYKTVELSYKLSNKILTISNFLKEKYKNTFAVESEVIQNGINYDLLYKKNNNKKIKTITLFIRNNYLKGDFIALDIFKNIVNKYKDIEINLLYLNNKLQIPFYDKNIKVNKFFGPFKREEINKILFNSDLYIDTSLTEGFGLVPLEAMASGNVVITSNSGGVTDYIKDNFNGFIINDVLNVNSYMEKIDLLINDEIIYNKIKNNINVNIFDYNKVVDKYYDYFKREIYYQKKELKIEEKKLYLSILDKRFKVSNNKNKNFVYKICKKLPKGFKSKIKKIIAKLYKITNDF